MVATDDLEDAAQKAVSISNIIKQAQDIQVQVAFDGLPI